MKKNSMLYIAIAVAVYPILFVLGSSCGLIHPMCYAYIGTFMPLLMSFVYLYAASEIQFFGAAVLLNGFLAAIASVTGEANAAFFAVIGIVTVLAEIIRKIHGYETLKGVEMSFIPFAYSFYGYTLHWWTNTAESLAEAVEEMPAGYADKMAAVISNIPVLIIMLIMVIPVSIMAIRFTEKLMKRQTAKLK